MRRLETLRRLSAAGVPTTVMVAPVIPALNDSEIERILEAAHAAGVQEAATCCCGCRSRCATCSANGCAKTTPTARSTCSSSMRDMRGGKDYDSKWFERQRGRGPYA